VRTLLCRIRSWHDRPRKLRIIRHSLKSWLSVCASGGTALIWQRVICRGFRHRDFGNEDPDQSIGSPTVAACISLAVQLRSPQALPYKAIWSLRLDDPAVGVDVRPTRLRSKNLRQTGKNFFATTRSSAISNLTRGCLMLVPALEERHFY
jgi:hypothetical protein